MPLYRIDEREVVEADTPEQLVDRLRMTSRSPVPDNRAFRERAAMWAGELNGVAIRTENDVVFIEDMLTHGIWSVEPSH